MERIIDIGVGVVVGMLTTMLLAVVPLLRRFDRLELRTEQLEDIIRANFATVPNRHATR
jgi:hypothetical protein